MADGLGVIWTESQPLSWSLHVPRSQRQKRRRRMRMKRRRPPMTRNRHLTNEDMGLKEIGLRGD